MTAILGIFLTIELFLVVGEGVFFTFTKGGYDWKQFLTYLGHKLGRNLLGLTSIYLAGTALNDWFYGRRLFTLEISGPLLWVLVFVFVEFIYYWHHRLLHRVSLFWATHSVHHSPRRMNFATSDTLGWLGGNFFLTGYVLMLPVFLLGLRPEIFMFAYRLQLRLQLWIHTEWNPNLGWLAYVVNTPARHRAHHSMNREYQGCNYGGLLIVFDRLFGTLVEEKKGIPMVYGVEGMPVTYNPLTVNLHGWKVMTRNIRKARTLRQFFGSFLSAPPTPYR
ncbi:MAG: sterol desaturase family protein [Bacteriovoracia bacterium]